MTHGARAHTVSATSKGLAAKPLTHASSSLGHSVEVNASHLGAAGLLGAGAGIGHVATRRSENKHPAVRGF